MLLIKKNNVIYLLITFVFFISSCDSDFFNWNLPQINDEKCIYLNGDNQFLCSANNDFTPVPFILLNGKSDVSFSFWIKPISYIDSSNTPSSYLYRSVFSIGNNLSNFQCNFWIFEGNSGRLDFSMNNNSGLFGRASNENLIYNEWNHILLSISLNSNEKFKCYVNGMDATINHNLNSVQSFNYSNAATFFRIGHSMNQNHRKFNGYIDDFAIWNTEALSDEDAKQIYSYNKRSRLKDFSKVPSIWYRMGEEYAFPSILNYYGGSIKLLMNNMNEESVLPL